MAEPARSTSEPELAKNLSTGKPGRHVAFEVPSHYHHHPHHRSGLSDIDANMDHLDKGRYRPCCFAFCVWACLGLFTLVIILLIIGISYLAFVQAGMPQVNVGGLHITKLQIDDSQSMDAAVSLEVRVSNKNQKLTLLYGPLTVDVITGEDVQLGKNKVGGFSQNPQNDTDLVMTMTSEKAKVDSHAVDKLRSDMQANDMSFDVYLSGKIGLNVGGFQMIRVPFLSSCRQIKQMDVDSGKRPGCDVKIFAFRPSSN